MKKNTFITTMTVIGAISGFWIVAILMAVAAPVFDTYILTQREWHQFELMRRASELLFWSNDSTVMFGIALAISVTMLVLLLRVVNPNIGKAAFLRGGPFLRFASAFVLSFVIFPVVIAILKEVLSIRSGVMNVLDLGLGGLTGMEAAKSIAFHVLFSYGVQFGIIWVLLGEQGWLGDMSSWRVALRENGMRYRRVFISGMLVGVGTAATLALQSWFFGRYFVLVSEVLDRTGETSFTGFLYFLAAFVIMMSLLGCIFAGLTVALAPVERSADERKQGLRMPIALIGGMMAVMLVIYAYTSNRYDLNKAGLAQAVGISDTASKSMTLVVTESGKGRKTYRAVAWPLVAEASGMVNASSFEVSKENLEKISQYLDDHPQGTVFRYVAMDALIKGYNVLGQAEKSLEYQDAFSRELLLPRVTLIARLRAVPVTADTRRKLDSFADEDTWHIGGRYAVKLAEAFIHQGRLAEAKTWYEKAKAKSTDKFTLKEIEKVTIPSGPGLTTGRITGRLLVNGAQPEGATVLLFSDNGHPLVGESSVDVGVSLLNAMSVRLAAAKQPDGSGSFSFDHLGEGSYVLAFLVGQQQVSAEAAADRLKVGNNPGVFRLDRKRSVVDLGKIHIAVR